MRALTGLACALSLVYAYPGKPFYDAVAEKKARSAMALLETTGDAAACPKCGFNAQGVPNCCSTGGAWAGSCVDSKDETSGEHTWVGGFNACVGAEKAVAATAPAPAPSAPAPEPVPAPASESSKKKGSEQEAPVQDMSGGGENTQSAALPLQTDGTGQDGEFEDGRIFRLQPSFGAEGVADSNGAMGEAPDARASTRDAQQDNGSDIPSLQPSFAKEGDENATKAEAAAVRKAARAKSEQEAKEGASDAEEARRLRQKLPAEPLDQPTPPDDAPKESGGAQAGSTAQQEPAIKEQEAASAKQKGCWPPPCEIPDDQESPIAPEKGVPKTFIKEGAPEGAPEEKPDEKVDFECLRLGTCPAKEEASVGSDADRQQPKVTSDREEEANAIAKQVEKAKREGTGADKDENDTEEHKKVMEDYRKAVADAVAKEKAKNAGIKCEARDGTPLPCEEVAAGCHMVHAF